jgi:hypothetical protein
LVDLCLSIDLLVCQTETVPSSRLLSWWELGVIVDAVLDIHAANVLDIRQNCLLALLTEQIFNYRVYLALMQVGQSEILVNVLESETLQKFETL